MQLIVTCDGRVQIARTTSCGCQRMGINKGQGRVAAGTEAPLSPRIAGNSAARSLITAATTMAAKWKCPAINIRPAPDFKTKLQHVVLLAPFTLYHHPPLS